MYFAVLANVIASISLRILPDKKLNKMYYNLYCVIAFILIWYIFHILPISIITNSHDKQIS